MRHRIRIQPYVTPEIHRKLRAYSAANDLTDSAVAEAALGDFLEPDGVDEALIMRRLDGVAQVLAQLQHDLAVVSQAVADLARTPFTAAASDAVTRGDQASGGQHLSGISRTDIAPAQRGRDVGR